MESPLESRICPKCQQTKPLHSFFKNLEECRSCFLTGIPRATAPEQAEKHRQEKILRAELKRLAKQRMAVKKAHAKAAQRKRAQEKLMPPVVKAEDLPEVDEATRELAKRTLARRRLIEFIKQFHPRYRAGWVHYDICARLEKFAREVEEAANAGRMGPRLMLLMPPRHGKSQIASKLFPAWHLGHYPHHEFIACSYNISLALEFSREVRGVIRSDPYRILFPGTVLNEEVQAAENWKIVSPTGVGGGGYVAAGIGGPITGKGAHVLVIDDPVKNAEEADSLDIREKNKAWYRSTAYSRLAPGGGVLLIQTCWHDDDLAGWLQKEMRDNEEADKFEIVKYPAIAEEDEEFRAKGDPLHPERYNLEALKRIKAVQGPRYWSALYQQNPVPEEGAFFTREMFKIRDLEPDLETLDIYQAWDFAVSDRHIKGNNWTVGVTIGVDSDDMAHLLEVKRLKTSDYELIEDSILDMYAKYQNIKDFGGEDGQIWRTMMHSLKKRMTERRIFIPLADKNPLKPVTSKEVRARPLQARLQNGRITFPKTQFTEELINEFIRFPNGAQDDQVDAMAWCIHLILRNGPPLEKRKPRNRTELTVEQQIRRLGVDKSVSNHMVA